MAFRIASSPYTHNTQSTSKVMLWVIFALIPGIAVQSYFFGLGNLIQIALAAIVAIISEAAILKIRNLPVVLSIKDHSASLTAVLLGMSIPAYAPWWVITIGTLFAIIIAKQLYGGLGQNPFNPAMIGYVVLLISFPVQMTSWPAPFDWHSHSLSFVDSIQLIFTSSTSSGETLLHTISGVDGITQATPLDKFKTALKTSTTTPVTTDSDYFIGTSWLWLNVSFLMGGLLLLWRKYISWQIPVSFLTMLLICSGLSYLISPKTSASPLLYLFSGATMLGAFFIATDPVTASTTTKGRLIFGALIGFLVWLIRAYGSYPDAVAFSVLLANITVPLIDHYTQPRVYGH